MHAAAGNHRRHLSLHARRDLSEQRHRHDDLHIERIDARDAQNGLVFNRLAGIEQALHHHAFDGAADGAQAQQLLGAGELQLPHLLLVTRLLQAQRGELHLGVAFVDLVKGQCVLVVQLLGSKRLAFCELTAHLALGDHRGHIGPRPGELHTGAFDD